MSRGLSTAIKNALAGSAFRTATMTKLEFNTTYYFTNAPSTIVYDSNSYVSTGLFLDVQELEENSTITTGSLNMRLSSVATSIMDDLFTYGYVDRQVTVFLAMLDSDMAIIDSPVQIFQGFVNTISVQEDAQNSILTLLIANQWAQFDKINGRYLTDTSQQRYFSGDLAFNLVPQTGKQLEWGVEKD